MSDIYLVVMEIHTCSTSRTLRRLHRHDLQNLFHKISADKKFQWGVKPYHKRLLWLIDFSQEVAPTLPRSRGRLGMIHPEGHKGNIQGNILKQVGKVLQSLCTRTHALPQQGLGIFWQVWRSCNGSEQQTESACWGWMWPLWQSQTLLKTKKTNKQPQIEYLIAKKKKQMPSLLLSNPAQLPNCSINQPIKSRPDYNYVGTGEVVVNVKIFTCWLQIFDI